MLKINLISFFNQLFPINNSNIISALAANNFVFMQDNALCYNMIIFEYLLDKGILIIQ